jgi:hypothetical protein
VVLDKLFADTAHPERVNAMFGRLHGDYFIMAFPSFDTAANGWAPQADVSWNHKSPSRNFAFIRFRDRFKTEAEAIAFALDMTEAWIDRHTRRLHSQRFGSERAQVIDVVDSLKKSLAKAAPKQPQPGPAATPHGIEKAFTFDQFKSAMARKGLHIGEPTLRKSYAALVELRRRSRLSWTEARRKVEGSKPDITVEQSPIRRGAKSTRIPLTEREWRRIG